MFADACWFLARGCFMLAGFRSRRHMIAGYFFGFHLAIAALDAMLERCVLVRDCALANPPILDRTAAAFLTSSPVK